MNNYYFYSLILFFISGIILGIFFDLSFEIFLLLIIFYLLSLIFLNNFKLIVFLIIFFLFIGFFRSDFIKKESDLEPRYTSFQAKIVSDPDSRENYTIYKVKYKDEYIRVYLSRFSNFEYGDALEIEGDLVSPKNFKNENGIEFDYISFLSREDVYFEMFQPKVSFVSSEYSFKKKIFIFKNFLIEKLMQALPSPYAELSAGILLGDKRSIGKELLDKFRIVGLIHIIVLSGYNLTIIASLIKNFFSFLPRLFNNLLSIFLIIIFVVMVGAGPAIVRAGVMSVILIFSESINRKYSVNRSLFFAGACMIFINPKIVLYDPGFQLSFLATLGLIHISPLIDKKLFLLPNHLREIISTTLATQISVTPLLIFMTGEISIVSIFANILVLPTIPIPMIILGFSLLTFFLPIFVQSFFYFPAYLILFYQIKVVEILSGFKFSTFVFTKLF